MIANIRSKISSEETTYFKSNIFCNTFAFLPASSPVPFALPLIPAICYIVHDSSQMNPCPFFINYRKHFSSSLLQNTSCTVSTILQKPPHSIPKRLIICCFAFCMINRILNDIKTSTIFFCKFREYFCHQFPGIPKGSASKCSQNQHLCLICNRRLKNSLNSAPVQFF